MYEKNITLKNLKRYSKNFNNNKTNKILKNVNTKGQFYKLIEKADYNQKNKQIFKKFIDVESIITDQKQSGRCWLFSSLNVIRFKMIKKYKLKNFEFSETFLFFYDKLEKANYFVNLIVKNKHLSNNDNKLIHILNEGISDGGTWPLFKMLVNKYGLIPKNNMKDLYHSANSHELSSFLSNYLKKAAKLIRKTDNQNMNNIKEKILNDCYKILVIFLGEPPKNITWEYYSTVKNKKKYNIVRNIKPTDFYKKYVPYNVNDKINLINYPCKPYYKNYNNEISLHVDGYFNVPISVLHDMCIKSIDNNEAVMVAVDWGKFRSRYNGFLDQNAFNYKDVFGFNNIMNKCDSLIYRTSYPNHAITIKGYTNDKNKKNSGFYVENSHGKKSGFDGYYYMSNDWFNQYMYGIVVDKKILPKNIKKYVNTKTVILPYNDPFAALQ